jgi:DNA repair protein RecO (recombination protein O)
VRPDRDRLYKTEAIVLKRLDLGEADKIVTLFTPGLGKVRAVAKGVRKLKSRLAGHIELFSFSTMMLAMGRNLDVVTQSETIDPFRHIRADLWRTVHACYACELLDRLTEERMESYPAFKLLLTFLRWLDGGEPPELCLRSYELQLLGVLGYGPSLTHCVNCQALLQPEVNYFSAPVGGMLCPACGTHAGTARPVSVAAQKVLRVLARGDIETMRRLRVSPDLHRELEAITRGAAMHVLEADLKSATFLDSLRAQRQ